MEGNVVYCPQNAMLILPRRMLKIFYQLCIWSMSVGNAAYNMTVYVDAIKTLGAHIVHLPFYSAPFFISLNLLASSIKSKVQLY